MTLETHSSSAGMAEAVYQSLRSKILWAELRPLEPLSEVDLAERYDISRTPVRECLQRLANDGLVRYQRRRWYVVDHTAEDVREMYELRAALEGFAAGSAARNASDERLAELALLKGENAFEAVSNDQERVLQNKHFHDEILVAGGNVRIRRAVEQTVVYHFNRRVAALYTVDRLKEVSRDHQEIIEAICARDDVRAEELGRSHVLKALDDILGLMF